MTAVKVRRAELEDSARIASISRSTWEGSDYLEGRSSEWITDGSLFVGEYRGDVVGTFRISPMPDGVLWLEALRVHGDLRGRGFGRSLADAAFQMALDLTRAGKGRCIELSTYFNNHESIHIIESQGFRIVDRFVILHSELKGQQADISEIEPSLKDFDDEIEHISCGWKFPRLCPEGVLWALERSRAWRCREACFLMKMDASSVFPLKEGRNDPEGFFLGAETAAMVAGREELELMLPLAYDDLISLAFARGYESWEPLEECNVLVFRYDPQAPS
ncbi:MAG: GNAT family N-acetyltransferase [Candidatus Aegiribacteria sp.]|nr:GNAT family N-acetyltransferase [Candidatus Aegiribacteria sp.]MBD3293959.1 GNAT family N-acetyltransferase [Candidatus Fermentibacteria bacterium]